MENPFQFTGTGDADLPSPDQPPPPPPPTVRRPVGRNWLLPILVPYSAFMTIAAIMYYYKYSEALQNPPLATIPDLPVLRPPAQGRVRPAIRVRRRRGQEVLRRRDRVRARSRRRRAHLARGPGHGGPAARPGAIARDSLGDAAHGRRLRRGQEGG